MKTIMRTVFAALLALSVSACFSEVDETDEGAGGGGGGGTTATTGTGTGADRDGDNWVDTADCKPDDASIHPGATELCGNGTDDDCDGGVDEGCIGGGTATTGATATSTGSGGTSQGMRQLYAHYKPGFDISKPVWTQIEVYGSPNPSQDGAQECLMSLWGANGPNEVYVCYFMVPIGATVEVSGETLKAPNDTASFLFDMCDYPGGGGNCEGLGSFCEDNSGGIKAQDGHDHIHGYDFWWTQDAVDGLGVNYGWIDNADPLGTCNSNQLIKPVT